MNDHTEPGDCTVNMQCLPLQKQNKSQLDNDFYCEYSTEKNVFSTKLVELFS